VKSLEAEVEALRHPKSTEISLEAEIGHHAGSKKTVEEIRSEAIEAAKRRGAFLSSVLSKELGLICREQFKTALKLKIVEEMPQRGILPFDDGFFLNRPPLTPAEKSLIDKETLVTKKRACEIFGISPKEFDACRLPVADQWAVPHSQAITYLYRIADIKDAVTRKESSSLETAQKTGLTHKELSELKGCTSGAVSNYARGTRKIPPDWGWEYDKAHKLWYPLP
jgi:hypothetical protein